MTRSALLPPVLAALLALSSPAGAVAADTGTPPAAWSGQAAVGHGIAQERCSRCHAIEASGDSPVRNAPPFRTLHQRFPVEDIAESLAEGIMVVHDGFVEMPLQQLSPQEIEDFLAYLKVFEGEPLAKP